MPRKVSRSERPMPPPAPVTRTRFIRPPPPLSRDSSAKTVLSDNRPATPAGSFMLLQRNCLKISNHQNFSGLRRQSERRVGSNSGLRPFGKPVCRELRINTNRYSARAVPILTQPPGREAAPRAAWVGFRRSFAGYHGIFRADNALPYTRYAGDFYVCQMLRGIVNYQAGKRHLHCQSGA